MIRRVSMRIVLALCFALGLGAMACNEEREFEGDLPDRSAHFERLDRIFEDEDVDPVCFNENGANFALFVGGQPDLTRSPRQGFDGQDRVSLRGFPDAEDGPLFGHDKCSVNSKNWSGGYYKRIGAPQEMGDWCVKYGLRYDCQATDMTRSEKDLHISYFNGHALPVRRVTICNNETSVDEDGDPIIRTVNGRGKFADQEFTGVGLACVNLNYICPQRVSPGVRVSIANDPDRTIEDKSCDPFGDDLDDPDCAACEAVSVAMQYDFPVGGDRPVVGFIGYRGVGAEAKLMDRIDLDFSGVEDVYETIPNICQNCHGAEPYEPLDPTNPTAEEVDILAQMVPLNPRFAMRDFEQLFEFLEGDRTFEDALMPLEGVTDPAEAQAFIDGDLELKDITSSTRADISGDLIDTLEIDKLILSMGDGAQKVDGLGNIGGGNTDSNAATLKALADVFEDAIGDDELNDVEFHLDREIPDGWVGSQDREDFYRLVAEHCNDSCHLALPGPLAFETYDQFIQYRDTIARDMCNDFSMPHSPESFNLFWTKAEGIGSFSRGDDVEKFLTYEDENWKAISPDPSDCGLPPLALGAATGQVELTSKLVFEKKKASCLVEIVTERTNQGLDDDEVLNLDEVMGRGDDDNASGLLRNCDFICGPAVLPADADAQRYDTAARFNKAQCNEISEQFNLEIPNIQ